MRFVLVVVARNLKGAVGLYKMLDRKRVLALLDDYEECSDRFPMPHEYSCKQLSIRTCRRWLCCGLGVSVQP